MAGNMASLVTNFGSPYHTHMSCCRSLRTYLAYEAATVNRSRRNRPRRTQTEGRIWRRGHWVAYFVAPHSVLAPVSVPFLELI